MKLKAKREQSQQKVEIQKISSDSNFNLLNLKLLKLIQIR